MAAATIDAARSGAGSREGSADARFAAAADQPARTAVTRCEGPAADAADRTWRRHRRIGFEPRLSDRGPVASLRAADRGGHSGDGDPIIVTPFFERPSVAETLAIPAEIRTWNEDEEPLKLVADFLRERGVAADPVGFEETDRYFIVDRLQQAAPRLEIGQRQSGGARPAAASSRRPSSRSCKPPTTLRSGQCGMPPRPPARYDSCGLFSAAIDAATAALGGSPEFSLVLIDEASAQPHGSKKPQLVRAGSTVLFDCGCTVHGYQSDISRTFVFGAAPTAEQRKVWNQVHEGQQIAIRAAKIGAPAGASMMRFVPPMTSWGYGPGYKLPGLSHRTGHGIGMDGHEPAYLVHGDETPLAAGMCFSDEPGIYIPGKFGVRLEDCWYMTSSGPKFFTQPPPGIDQPFG